MRQEIGDKSGSAWCLERWAEVALARGQAEKAVRAALDMQKAAVEFESITRAQLGAPLQIRIGVNSGLAVAGILGTQQQAAYTVIGETVNLAARLQAAAREASAAD